MKAKTKPDESRAALNLLGEARAEADQLRARLRMMEQIVLSTRLIMGHELKKPATAIRGYLDLALEEVNGQTPDGFGDSLRKARSECDLLNDLNLFFLELLKIDNSEEVLRGRRINLRDFVFDVPGFQRIFRIAFRTNHDCNPARSLVAFECQL